MDFQSSLDSLLQFSSEYRELNNTLRSLPLKIEHSIMVPISPVAFTYGKLIHTNQVMSFLGDQYFTGIWII